MSEGAAYFSCRYTLRTNCCKRAPICACLRFKCRAAFFCTTDRRKMCALFCGAYFESFSLMISSQQGYVSTYVRIICTPLNLRCNDERLEFIIEIFLRIMNRAGRLKKHGASHTFILLDFFQSLSCANTAKKMKTKHASIYI